jgi:hypothetical protein
MKSKPPKFTSRVLGLFLGVFLAIATCASATGQTQARAGQGGERQNLVAAAADELLRQPNLEAKIRHRVDLFDHELVGLGLYQQLGEGAQQLRRLELKLQAGEQAATVQQVCAGRFLWTRREQQGTTTLSRIDLRKVRETLAAANRAPGFDPAVNWMAIGGLPKLLHSLDENFDFAPPQEGRIGEVPVSIVAGRWKPDRLAALLPEQRDAILAGQPARLDRLPPHVPDQVQVTLGRDNLFPLFPYRIEYLRGQGRGGKDLAATDSPKAIVTMELFEVRRRDDLDRRQFIYEPGEQEVIDQTETFLKGLR